MHCGSMWEARTSLLPKLLQCQPFHWDSIMVTMVEILPVDFCMLDFARRCAKTLAKHNAEI
jgi:hypothetical protein